ncbi:helix-turn-helix domain-containing protein [Lysinibacillus fusiformis]|uniref:helix-turn-helix domain-containing protein n=1 Tax=Lysinibacillus fusiformis TaxID=28031 RepID=UPI003D027E8D
MESKLNQFGARLKNLRVDRGFSMQHVADSVGVARSTYAGYESEYRVPPLETLAKLAETLNTTADYLLGLSQEPSPGENSNDLAITGELFWNGIPLSNQDLKMLRDLFQVVIKDRMPKMRQENQEEETN